MVSADLSDTVNKRLILLRNSTGRPPGAKSGGDTQASHVGRKKTAGPKPRRDVFKINVADQRSSCNTLCCDWLASDSAETAIDWRVDSAWLLAASWLVSAKVRFDEPVCSTLIRFLLKS